MSSACDNMTDEECEEVIYILNN